MCITTLQEKSSSEYTYRFYTPTVGRKSWVFSHQKSISWIPTTLEIVHLVDTEYNFAWRIMRDNEKLNMESVCQDIWDWVKTNPQ